MKGCMYTEVCLLSPHIIKVNNKVKNSIQLLGTTISDGEDLPAK